MSHRAFFPLLAAALFLAAPAAAAPVSATATLSIQMPGLAGATFTGAGTVDVTGGVLTLPVGLVSVPGSIVVPVTNVTAVNSLSFVGVGNLSGTFSIGGVTAQAPGEICPGGVVPNRSACNVGGSLGGVMGITGTINVNIIPGVVVIPLNLGGLQIGQGGSGYSAFSYDAAAWTTGTGLLDGATSTLSTVGSSAANHFLLVTPLFVSGCGNLLPIFGSLTIDLLSVPEPTTWVLLWLGGLGVVLATGRRR